MKKRVRFLDEEKGIYSNLHTKGRQEVVQQVDKILGRLTENWAPHACSVLAMYASS